MKKLAMLLGGVALGSVLLSPQIYAQTTGGASTGATGQSPDESKSTAVTTDDIVVTARRRSELLQDVPIAVSAITQETAVRTGITGVEAISIATPSLNYSRQISQGGTPFLRGVGNTQAAAGGESPVAVYVDDVYIGSPNGNIFAFNNVASIQVLKGPQGTLFGRNATGGVIQVQTKSPSFDPEMEASAGYGNYNSIEGSFYGSTGLSKTLAINIAASGHKQYDGFGHSAVTGVETQKGWDWNVRGKLLWQPGDMTKFLLTGDYGKQRSDIGSNGGVYPGTVSVGGGTFIAPYVTSGDGSDYGYIKNGGVSLRIDQETSFADLVSISAYRHTSLLFFVDQDRSPAPLVIVGPVRSPYTSYSQEFQIVSKPESPIKWIVGVFYMNSRTGYDPATTSGLFVSSNGGPDMVQLYDKQKLNSYSAFGETTFKVLPETNLTLGLRYTRDVYDLDVQGTYGTFGTFRTLFPGSTFTKHDIFPKVTYRAILDHKFTPDIMGYASYSRGFRSGGYNLAFPGTAANPSPAVKPEILDSYEVGLKTKLFDGNLTLNGAAFYYDYKNLAVAFVQVGGSLTLNAAAAHIKGLDFDFIATPFHGLRINGGIGILDAKYVDFPNGPILVPNPGTCAPTPHATGAPTGGNMVCFGDLSGKNTVHAPKFTMSVAPSYTLETDMGSFTLAGSFYHNSGYALDLQNRTKQGSYDLVNGSLTWESTNGKFSLRLWAKNLTNTKYFSFASPSIVSDDAAYEPPRTYGATMTVKM